MKQSDLDRQRRNNLVRAIERVRVAEDCVFKVNEFAGDGDTAPLVRKIQNTLSILDELLRGRLR